MVDACRQAPHGVFTLLHKDEPCTLTNADLYLQGIFGQGFTEPTGINSIEADQDAGKPVKMIENGQLVIKRNGVKYNLQGQVIE